MIVEDVRHRAARRGRSATIEMAADAVARKVFVAANRTFNAPIDREDILQLAHVLDDAVDLIEDTAKGIRATTCTSFRRRCTRWPTRSSRARERLQKVMPYLDSVARDHKTIFALCEEIGQIEGRADESFDHGLTQSARAASRRRDRHHRLHRPQGALRARRERRRQVRRHRQRHAVHHRQARLSAAPRPADDMDAAALGLPVLIGADRGRAAVRLPERPARRRQLDRDGRRHARAAPADRGHLGGVLQLHRVRGVRPARRADRGHRHRQRRASSTARSSSAR